MSNYAKIVDGEIASYYQSGKPYTDANGVRYPRTIWQNADFLATQGIKPIIDGVSPNTVFYTIGGEIISYDAVADTVNRAIQSQEKTVEQLTSYFTNNVISEYKQLLSETNYHIIRSQEDADYTVPTDISTWRATINSEYDSNITAINACTTHSDFVSLTISWTRQDGVV